MVSTTSTIVQVLASIVVGAIVITLVIAIFSYIGYKIRQRRKPEIADEIPDFFYRFTPEMFLPPPQSAGALGSGDEERGD